MNTTNHHSAATPSFGGGRGEASYIFETRMQVRDYECDIQGIVNNANYLHYIEHTRHRFIRSLGLSFADLHSQGIDAVVARMNIQYKSPLRCDDEFISRLNVAKKGAHFVFQQDIYRAADEQLCFTASVVLVVLVGGQLVINSPYDELLNYVARNN